LVIQIINLTHSDVFKKYSSRYKIYRDVYQPGLYGLEIRNVPRQLASEVQKIVLHENEICYKSENVVNNLDLFIPGAIWNFKELSRRILSGGDEELGYKITNIIKNYEEYDLKSYRIGEKDFNFSLCYTMGILNVTPDSFSDGGLYLNEIDAVNHAINMIDAGADIIDIGGESTRPGALPVEEKEELERVIPVIKKIIELKPDAIISVDTNKSKVAGEALKCGAKIINDISGFTFDPNIFNIVKKYDAGIIIMHIKGIPNNMQQDPSYEDAVAEIFDHLYKQTTKAVKNGIKNIFIDPGIGFGKRFEDNIAIIRRLEDFKCLGYPIVIGVSRKAFLGKIIAADVNQRDIATAIMETAAAKAGARIIRTHNIQIGTQVKKILNQLH